MSQNKTIWIINQYASTPETGMGGRHYYIGRALAKLGYTVYIIAASYTHLLREPITITDEFKVQKITEDFRFVWVNMPQYPEAHSKKRIINWFSFAWKLPKLKNKLPKPDIILYSSPSLVGYLGAEKLAKKLKVPLAFEVRDIWPLTLCEVGGYSNKHPFIMLLQAIEKKAYKNADFVISNLKNSYQHMQSLGMHSGKFTWIPNGFLKDEVENAAPLSTQTVEQLPKGKFIVGYTGTLGVANALEALINAANRLKEYSDIAFVLVGHGKQKAYLEEQASLLGLENIHFIDPIPKVQIQSMLNTFNICYIGLTKDPLFRFGVSPNKLFDYLYSGKPIIYAIDSGSYKPISDARAGIQIEPENDEQIAKAILDIYNMSAEQRELMGKNGHKEALQSYEYNSLAKKLIAVLLGD